MIIIGNETSTAKEKGIEKINYGHLGTSLELKYPQIH
jgi:hypothetical protein